MRTEPNKREDFVLPFDAAITAKLAEVLKHAEAAEAALAEVAARTELRETLAEAADEIALALRHVDNLEWHKASHALDAVQRVCKGVQRTLLRHRIEHLIENEG